MTTTMGSVWAHACRHAPSADIGVGEYLLQCIETVQTRGRCQVNAALCLFVDLLRRPDNLLRQICRLFCRSEIRRHAPMHVELLTGAGSMCVGWTFSWLLVYASARGCTSAKSQVCTCRTYHVQLLTIPRIDYPSS